MGFLEVLQIVFIVLKLCGVIDWSWWLVLVPLFAAVLLYVVIVIWYVITRISLEKMEKKYKGDM